MVLGACRQFKQFCKFNAFSGFQTSHRQFPFRQCSRFIEDDGADSRRLLDVRHILNQNTKAGGRRDGRDDRRRRRDDERRGNGHDQHGDDTVDAHRDEPHKTRDHQNRRRVIADIFVDHSHNRQLGTFGIRNQITDFTQRRIRTDARHAEFDQTCQVLRSRINFIANRLIRRQRFTRNRRLVDRTRSDGHHTVRREVFARTDAAHVSGLQIREGVHFLFHAIDDSAGQTRRQPHDRFDRRLGADSRPLLYRNGNQHEEGDGASRLVVFARKCGHKRQGHQFVHMDLSFDQITDRLKENRQAQNQCADQRAEIAGRFINRIREEDTRQIAVQDEYPAEQRNAQSQHFRLTDLVFGTLAGRRTRFCFQLIF